MAAQENSRPKALITGASSGLGAAFAERLAHDGYDLILVARRRPLLDALAAKLEDTHAIRAAVLAADLTRPDELLLVEKRVAEDALMMLVNNAGFGGYMPFVSLDADRAEELIHLQVVALTRLTRAALPGMIERGDGAVINVSSRLAFSAGIGSPPLPKRAAYAASKSYINTFSQILADELKETGVRVQALCPGVIETEFHEKVGTDPASFPAGIVMSPDDVVDASLAGLSQGEVVCIPGLADPTLLEQVVESQRHLFEQSRSGDVAKRYRP